MYHCYARAVWVNPMQQLHTQYGLWIIFWHCNYASTIQQKFNWCESVCQAVHGSQCLLCSYGTIPAECLHWLFDCGPQYLALNLDLKNPRYSTQSRMIATILLNNSHLAAEEMLPKHQSQSHPAAIRCYGNTVADNCT